jgi:hypothetical protein
MAKKQIGDPLLLNHYKNAIHRFEKNFYLTSFGQTLLYNNVTPLLFEDEYKYWRPLYLSFLQIDNAISQARKELYNLSLLVFVGLIFNVTIIVFISYYAYLIITNFL